MLNDNTKLLLAIPEVMEVQRLTLTKDLLASLKDKASVARGMQRTNTAYRIVYRSNGHAVVGYLIEPKSKGPHPCMIWNRGGSNVIGAITEQFVFAGDLAFYAQSGYVVIASQYSGNNGSEGVDLYGGDDVNDVIVLQRILKRYANADERRIGMFGWSRGGMMTFLALARVPWIKAAVVVAPVTDLARTVKHRQDLKKYYAHVFGNKDAEYKKRSVVHWVSKLPKNVPVLMMHGTGDRRIRPTGTLELSTKFYEAKIPHRTLIYEGADHLLTEYREEAKHETVAWLNRYVRDGEPLPNLAPHGV